MVAHETYASLATNTVCHSKAIILITCSMSMKNVTVYYFTYIHYIQLKRSDMLAMNVVIIEINLMSHDDFCKRDMTN